ncbi:HupE/UreJ family protein [Paenibacillus sp. MMO-177]|uniref:HupE/UreJ family protein n=1 Tax=Paenibacillus sp. MMO-177 TaxID=3081289 RepID=UPI00301680C2
MNRKRIRRLLAASMLGLFLLVAMLGGGQAVWAHSGTSLAYSDIRMGDEAVNYDLRIDMYDLRVAAAPNDPDVGDFSPEALQKFVKVHKDDVEAYLLGKIHLYADSLPLKGALLSLEATEALDQPYAEAKLRFSLPDKPEHFVLDYQAVYDDVDQLHLSYVTVALKEDGSDKQSYVLNYNNREVELGRISLLRAVKQFFILGIEHLITGYDHILFVLSLLIGARSIKQILGVVTAFTAAHTVTLLLAGFGVINLPGKLVESVIALSIIYVALNSILNKNASKHNLFLAFGFGLIHGCGFAATLSEMRLDGGQMAASLLTFNVGIEFGQLMIVLLLYPVIHYARRVRWTMPAMSATISVFGLIWLIQRAFL